MSDDPEYTEAIRVASWGIEKNYYDNAVPEEGWPEDIEGDPVKWYQDYIASITDSGDGPVAAKFRKLMEGE